MIARFFSRSRALQHLAAPLAVAMCLLLGSAAHAGTNSLTSVTDVDGTQTSGGTWWWHCEYQGNVSFTDADSELTAVVLHVGTYSEGSADYITQESGSGNIWDYHGTSVDSFYEGGTWGVYTEGAWYNPNQSPSTGWITSNTVSWHV